jgi:hypothetical protein
MKFFTFGRFPRPLIGFQFNAGRFGFGICWNRRRGYVVQMASGIGQLGFSVSFGYEVPKQPTVVNYVVIDDEAPQVLDTTPSLN